MRRKYKPYVFEDHINLHVVSPLLWKTCDRCGDDLRFEPMWTWWDDDRGERFYMCFYCMSDEEALIKQIMALRP